MSMFADIASWALLVGGAVFVVAGGIGLIRLPDFYCRMHAAGLVDTMGAGLIVAGLAIQAGFTQVTIKLGMILVFLFFTSPTATHAVAHAARVGGLKPWTRDKTADDGAARDGQENGGRENGGQGNDGQGNDGQGNDGKDGA